MGKKNVREDGRRMRVYGASWQSQRFPLRLTSHQIPISDPMRLCDCKVEVESILYRVGCGPLKQTTAMAAMVTSSSASQAGEKTQLPQFQLISSHFTECSTLMKCYTKECDNYVSQTLNNDSNNIFLISGFCVTDFVPQKPSFARVYPSVNNLLLSCKPSLTPLSCPLRLNPCH